LRRPNAAKRTTHDTYDQHGAVKVSKESHVTTEHGKSGMATIGKNRRLVNVHTEEFSIILTFLVLFDLLLPFGLSFNTAIHFCKVSLDLNVILNIPLK